MHQLLAQLNFRLLRRLERSMSPATLYRLLRPLAAARATLRQVSRKHKPSPLPACFPQATPATIAHHARQARLSAYLNTILEFLPDRLAQPQWQQHCTYVGLDRLEAARQNGRRVLLAFSHFGPYTLLRFWLRTAGIPAANLIRGKEQNRPHRRRIGDRFSPFPEIPTAICQEHLRDAIAFLAAGRPLLIALDGRAGKHIHVPIAPGWTFRMATGPLRLAASHGADLLPCLFVEEGPWRFRLQIGPAVPTELLADIKKGSGWEQACRHVLHQWWPAWQAHPEQCHELFLERFQPDDARAIAHAA